MDRLAFWKTDKGTPEDLSQIIESQPEPPGDENAAYDVSESIEFMGFGRYQWKVVLCMGLMSFADASEIWLSAVILKMLVCEWDLGTILMALIPTCVLFFYAIGSILSGKIADNYGRWPTTLISYYLICISATASAFSTSYIFFILCRSLTGFGIGSSYGVSVVYAQELVPKEKRSFTGMLLNVFWISGGIYECVLAFFVMGLENGWRIQILATVIPCYATLVIIHFLDESPRYLVITGQAEKAREVLVKISEQNGKPMLKGEIVVSQQHCGEYSAVFKSPHTKTSLSVMVLFICNMWTSYGALFMVADMMSYGYCSMSEFFDVIYVTENGCINYTKAEYIFYLCVAVLGIPGYLIGPWSTETIGRLNTFYYSTWGGTVVTILMLICFGSIIIYAELFVMLSFYAIFNSVLWIYTPEYYPTYIRTTAVGLLNGISKLGAAGGVFTTEVLDTVSITYTLYTYIVISLIAALTTLVLDSETKGTVLRDGRIQFVENTQPTYRSIENDDRNQESTVE